MLKEEPDDTAHYTLSPSSATSATNFGAGTDNNGTLNEPCLPPLDDSAPLFGEIFDELILPDGYGTLLADDITTSIDSQSSKINIDPFMSYRDESCDTVGTPNILSPETLSKVHTRSHFMASNRVPRKLPPNRNKSKSEISSFSVFHIFIDFVDDSPLEINTKCFCCLRKMQNRVPRVAAVCHRYAVRIR